MRLLVSAALALAAGDAGAATFVVTNPGASGTGSLLHALQTANDTSGDDVVVFDLPGPGPHLIEISGFLPLRSNVSVINDRDKDEKVTVRKSDSAGNSDPIFGPAGPNSYTALIAGLTITNGRNSNGGGAIVNGGAVLTLRNCTISGNYGGTGAGGAIRNFGTFAPAKLTLLNCTFENNHAETNGGAISNFSASGAISEVSLTNCTFTAHRSGVIYNAKGAGSGTAKITSTNCTFGDNSGANSSRASTIENTGGSVELRNTIFARRAGGGVHMQNFGGGVITSLGHNLSDDAAGGDASTVPGGFLIATGDIRNTDPQLQALADNGGPTETHALAETSPAVNAGDTASAPARDQRSFLRAGLRDIGAFEFQAHPLRILAITRSADEVIVSFMGGAGERFQLQRKSSLHEVTWNPAPGVPEQTILSDGPAQMSDPGVAGLMQVFHRVQLVP